ncbi:MAG: phenylalanine--tRNA ligase subunit alpha [Armatimonadetes bacterium]|nr:phenylalanine--tRNA ligase subunit alpha [Armatimonadota bacterium]
MDEIKNVVDAALTETEHATTIDNLEQVEIRYLGRKGEISQLLRSIGKLPEEERPRYGSRINEAKERLAAEIKRRRADLKILERRSRRESERLDITLPGVPADLGRLHPLTQTTERIIEVWTGLGFEFVDGPELEDYEHNFAKLNYPPDHPAIDEQMSFYIDDTHLLRTQTTALQGRVMATRKPPFRIATIGRCFRYEAVDATHHHTFHQVDVFMVDEGVSMADLKGMLVAFAREMFGNVVKSRFRPDFFPFVEPGVDFAIYWHNRWLELGGAGLIHPNILEVFGIDSERYTGFAFGLGIERIPMIQYGIKDLRYFLDNDLRFLRQF